MISKRIPEIFANIERICHKNHRDPQEITLIGVTKYVGAAQMQEAIQAGISEIGENRVQDAKQKFSTLEANGLIFKRHMIGHLQTNKVKGAVRLFDMIQSVDSVKVAKEIEKQAAAIDKVMDVLIQVNSSKEPQKSGIEPEQALELVKEISGLEHLRLQGLMTIGLFTDEKEKIEGCFHLTKDLFDRIKQEFLGSERVEMKYLSMGMTQDYEIALECGANMVRIGSAIFK